jgi:hypothetical protein
MIYTSSRCNLPTCRLRTIIQPAVPLNATVPPKLDQLPALTHAIRAYTPLPRPALARSTSESSMLNESSVNFRTRPTLSMPNGVAMLELLWSLLLRRW